MLYSMQFKRWLFVVFAVKTKSWTFEIREYEIPSSSPTQQTNKKQNRGTQRNIFVLRKKSNKKIFNGASEE